jgi:hypothetical protein
MVAILASTAIGAIGAAIVTGLFSRRRLGADAAHIIQQAASGVVLDLRETIKDERAAHDKEVFDLRDDLARLKQEWRDEREAWRRVNQLHVAFDMLAIARLAEAGIDLGMDPPPLLPPIKANLD